jgi:hypothetical protein
VVAGGIWTGRLLALLGRAERGVRYPTGLPGPPVNMDFSDKDVQQFAEADRREVDPPIEVQAATWSKAGQLDWWVKDRQEWWGRVRGVNGRQRSIKAVDLRPANDSQLWLAV